MSEPDSTAPARDNARAVDGPEGDLVQQDKNGVEDPVAPATQHEVAEPPSQESPYSDETLLRKALPQSDSRGVDPSEA